MERPAFVAGATGYVGRAVVAELAGRGVETIAHLRPDSLRLAEWTRRFAAEDAAVDTTRWDRDAMAATLDRLRPSHVFALLGTTRARVERAREQGREESYESVDHDLTALLLAATERASPDALFVYLSALGVGDKEPRNAYLNVRWRIEREVRSSGLAHLIVRPSLITGSDREERRPGERMAAVVLDALLGAIALLGLRRVRARYRSITAAALAHGLVSLSLDGERGGRTVATDAVRAAQPRISARKRAP